MSTTPGTRRVAAYTCATFLLGAAAWAQTAWTISTGAVTVSCPLTVGGSFEAKTTALSGRLSADTTKPGRFAGELAVDLATLDSGISLRNTHMRENYLEVGKGEGYQRAVLKDIVLAGDPFGSGATTFTATLSLHGIERPVRGSARVARADGGARVEAAFPVVLPDHGIAKPRYLGVGVRDEVQVKVKFQASAGETAAGSSR
jgi:polyisoprenoid-binding protein YceI